MKRALVTIGIAGLVALGIAFGLSQRSTPGTQPEVPRSDGSSDEVARLRNEVRALEREMRHLPARAAAAAEAALDAPTAAGPEAEAAPSEEEPVPSTQEVVQQVAANCDARLATEPRDPTWSRETVAAIHTTVGRLSPTARVLSADCASTVCRTVLESETAEAERELLSGLASEPPFASGTLYQYDRNGTHPRATLYVAREGHRLDPENAPARSPTPPSVAN